MKRLPIHPQPLPHEALTSWIRRMAELYDLDAMTFMERAFNCKYTYASEMDFDICAPQELIMALSKRTTVPVGKIRAMTIEGYAPLLIDTTLPAEGLFKAYISQFPTLAPIRNKFPKLLFSLDEMSWLPWVSPYFKDQSCTECIDLDPVPYRRIYWRLSWMVCCPLHGQMLEDSSPPRQASEAIIALDHLTLKAVSSGKVILHDGRTIHAAVWLRSLRTLIDELTRPISTLGQARLTIEKIWQSADRSRYMGSRKFLVFEYMGSKEREHIMQVVAETVEKLLEGAISPSFKIALKKGEQQFFLPYR